MNMLNWTPDQEDEYISKEEFCKICHIGKKKALRLIQCGLVPAIDTHLKTKRYLIKKRDVAIFLNEREKDPLQFEKSETDKIPCHGRFGEYSLTGAYRLRRTVEEILKHRPDMLRYADVTEILGYEKRTIDKWRNELGLVTMLIGHFVYFPKVELINFIVSPGFQGIKRKSPEHIELLRRANYA